MGGRAEVAAHFWEKKLIVQMRGGHLGISNPSLFASGAIHQHSQAPRAARTDTAVVAGERLVALDLARRAAAGSVHCLPYVDRREPTLKSLVAAVGSPVDTRLVPLLLLLLGMKDRAERKTSWPVDLRN